MKSFVVCQLPKAGLGNQLFPLMHARLFAALNKLDCKVVGYHQFKLGPYLRREKIKRNYSGYFNFEKSLFSEAIDKIGIRLRSANAGQILEPVMKVLQENETQDKIFVFEKLPTYHDYFIQLRDYRDQVRQLLYSSLQQSVTDSMDRLPVPVIGVHIRMGDFRKLKKGEKFSGGHVRTPLDYFVQVIQGIRKIHGHDLPVSVFSDGYPEELKEILLLPNVTMVEGNTDIQDLLLFSRSKILVTTTGSTFSYWAAFLSDAPVILHPDHIYAPFRPAYINERYYEGAFQPNSDLLLQNIKHIPY
ncbi:MAG TPA: alpha-1,2-fucosyltransferase [Ferruginibacter sp.]|nr:alpha-1,2-fucosyltransferase [Ferruginibacter sp.]